VLAERRRSLSAHGALDPTGDVDGRAVSQVRRHHDGPAVASRTAHKYLAVEAIDLAHFFPYVRKRMHKI
jgi:hypothetical protein